jgi:RNA polymerase sigma-70 factor (ECF subfamily)
MRRLKREQAVAADRDDYFESKSSDLIDAHAAQEALETLPPEQREIVVLRLWGQLTLAEIAALIGSPLSRMRTTRGETVSASSGSSSGKRRPMCAATGRPWSAAAVSFTRT